VSSSKQIIYNFSVTDYFLKTEYVEGNNQGGMWKRSYISLAYPIGKADWDFMLGEFKTLQENPEKKFTMVSHIWINHLRKIIPNIYRRGNCCYWTSEIFKKMGMCASNSHFPMVFFLKLLLPLSIIFMECIDHYSIPKKKLLYPFYWMKYGYYQRWNLISMANLIIRLFPTQNGYELQTKIVQNKNERIQRIIDYLKNIY
ncbi:MAG: hypothetical protein Satyrvirus23_19, partial [Satyrvirus sp.]